MNTILFVFYQAFLLILYLLLSAVLLYHRRIKRWLIFSGGFAIVYLGVSLLLFDRIPFNLPAIKPIVANINLVILLGIAIICAYGLIKGWNYDNFLGSTILFLVILVILLGAIKASNSSEPLQETVKKGFHSFQR